MSDNSKIEWCDTSWPVTVGCDHVSPGCDNCYAAVLTSGRLAHLPEYAGLAERGKFNGTVRCLPERLDWPLRWRKPRRIFVCSMSDLFHESVPDDFIMRVFDVMEEARWHTFQVLTKRHARMRSILRRRQQQREAYALAFETNPIPARRTCPAAVFARRAADNPPANIWVGVSVEDQKWADIRVPALLDTPAAVRFVSAEPLLGPVNLAPWLPAARGCFCETHWSWMCGGDINGGECRRTRLSWVIAGGESGPGARPLEADWIRAMVWQCRTTRVPLFVKQLGKTLGRELGAGPKGGDWDAWPEDLRVREFPRTGQQVAA